jgi:hypothetical protein
MEALRKIIDSKSLEALFPLPKPFHNNDMEIRALPVNKKPSVTEAMINDLLPGSVTQSLIGIIPSSPTAAQVPISLEDIRLERLQKYESIN